MSKDLGVRDKMKNVLCEGFSRAAVVAVMQKPE